MAQPYIVNGCAKTNAVHPRLEVRDLKETKPEQWSLFIQAVTNLMKKAPEDPTSWHQIAGIHGMPYMRWSGDPQGHPDPDPPTEEQWKGYCHHSSVLFPTWHRVVMLLVEQAVSVEAQDIAAKLPDDTEKIKWITAARELRFPFWDWTRVPGAEQGPPDILKSPTLKIAWPRTKKPTPGPVLNPLASYRFQVTPETMGFFPDMVDKETGIKQYWQKWLQTGRWPKSEETVVDDYGTMIDAFKQGTGPNFPMTYRDRQGNVKVHYLKDGLQSINTLRLLVADLFTYPLTDKDDKKKRNGALWDHFASASAQSKPPDGLGSSVGGLEQPHNTIHLLIGGHGHMAYNEFAAFDPIFFMHHANIDRIYAFWEYIYPNPWLDHGYYNPGDPENHLFYTAVPPDGGTYTQPLGTEKPLNHLTPLTPFRKTPETYWTSEDVRGNINGQGTSKLYYTYPPIVQDNQSVSIDTPYHTREQRVKYQGLLQKHFGLNTKLELDELALLARQPTMRLPQTFADTEVPRGYAPITNFRRFFIEVEMPRAAFSGSHRLDLNVTIGDSRAPLGYVSVLSRLAPERCGNCVQLARAGRPISGRIMLPAAVTLSLLDQHEMGVEHRGETTDDVRDPFHGLKHAFGAKIATPGSHPLAHAEPAGMTRGATRGISLKAGATPKLTLWSAAVAHPENDPNGAIERFDWKSHGELPSNWFDRRSVEEQA